MLSYGRFATSRLCRPTTCQTYRNVYQVKNSKKRYRVQARKRIACPIDKQRGIQDSTLSGLHGFQGRYRSSSSREGDSDLSRLYDSIHNASTTRVSGIVDDGMISAVPGPLNLFISSASQLQVESDASNTEEFVRDKKLAAEQLMLTRLAISQLSDGRFDSQLAVVLEEPQSIRRVLSTEQDFIRPQLAEALFNELLLRHPKTFCRAISSLSSAHNDIESKLLRNASSHYVTLYLYYQFLHDGLPSASIADEFYELLTATIKRRKGQWVESTLSILPMYTLRSRCPVALRQDLREAYNHQLCEAHFENQLIQVQRMVMEGRFSPALRVLRALQAKPFVLRTVEFFNTVNVVLDHAKQTRSKQDADWILSGLLSSPACNDKHLCPLLLRFAEQMRLHDGIRKITWHIMESSSPNAGRITQVLKSMHHLSMHDDQSDPVFTAYVDQISQEKSYALHSSLRRMRLQRKSEERPRIYEDMLEQLQKHANVEFLVELGVADTVTSPWRPLLDGPLVGLMLWQYFSDRHYSDAAVMPVYNRFKELIQQDSEMTRMACFPDGHVFDVFIITFGAMSKDRLNDALDILAELTHNHDPIKNMPQQLPEAMRNPARLHVGPNGRTYRQLMYALIRHGQFQAAERCLAEIWKKWPMEWDKPCDQLIKAYIQVGKNNKAAYLLNRKINAGFSITEQTMQALSVARTNFRSARKDFQWRKLETDVVSENELDQTPVDYDEQSWTDTFDAEEDTQQQSIADDIDDIDESM